MWGGVDWWQWPHVDVCHAPFRWIMALKASIKKWLPLHQALQDYMNRLPEETRMWNAVNGCCSHLEGHLCQRDISALQKSNMSVNKNGKSNKAPWRGIYQCFLFCIVIFDLSPFTVYFHATLDLTIRILMPFLFGPDSSESGYHGFFLLFRSFQSIWSLLPFIPFISWFSNVQIWYKLFSYPVFRLFVVIVRGTQVILI